MKKPIPKELELIIDYLSSECYVETMNGLDYEKDALLCTRQQIKHLSTTGKIEEMYTLVNEKYPNMLSLHPHVVSLIFSQIFIEFVRNSQPEKALEFGRNSVQNGQDITKNHDLFFLLAYKNPEECDNLKEFLSLERREKVFSAVDGLIKEKEFGRRLSLIEYIGKIVKCSGTIKKED